MFLRDCYWSILRVCMQFGFMFMFFQNQIQIFLNCMFDFFFVRFLGGVLIYSLIEYMGFFILSGFIFIILEEIYMIGRYLFEGISMFKQDRLIQVRIMLMDMGYFIV